MIIDKGNYKLYKGDCLEVMDGLISLGVKFDAIITDPPYGTTACKWDSIIPLDEMWKRLNKLIKPNGAIVLFSSQPFTTDLINSNRSLFRYDIVWNKCYGTDFALANRKPMKAHEIICVFYKKQPTYNKQVVKRDKVIDTTNWKQDKRSSINGNFDSKEIVRKKYDYKNPTTVFELNMAKGECNNSKRVHPTQKPIKLLEFLVKTYTNEGDLVLDFTCGSGSTGVACLNTGRRFVGVELDEKYFNIAKERLESVS